MCCRGKQGHAGCCPCLRHSAERMAHSELQLIELMRLKISRKARRMRSHPLERLTAGSIMPATGPPPVKYRG